MPTTTKKRITDTKICRKFVEKREIDLLFARSQWHEYANGVWMPRPDPVIEVNVWDLLEEYEKHHSIKPTLTKHKTVVSYAKSHLFHEEDTLDAFPSLINLKNGVFDLNKCQLVQHSSAFLLTSQLPFEYDENASCPWWTHYIKTTFINPHTKKTDESLVRLVQEAVAYSMTTDISHQVMFWCVGEGENGKGVLFHILNHLGGDSAIPLNLSNLSRERYQLATLPGKRIALCPEASSTSRLLEDATIKSLVSGDPIQVRQIHRSPFTLYPQAKLWWAMNRLPVVADTSHGMWRRIIMLPFNQIFDEKSRIKDLKEKLDQELSGIFNWCLEGHKRLQAEGHFSYCQQAEEMKGNFQYESNVIKLFVDDCCDKGDYKESASALYKLYSAWSKQNGYKPMSNRNFKQEMEAQKYFHKRESAGYYYYGLKIDSLKSQGTLPNPWSP